MKALVAIISVLAILGIIYALAFVGAIPVRKLAQSSKSAAMILTAIKLYHPAHASKAASTPAPVASAPDPLASDRAALQAQRAQLSLEKAVLDKKLAGSGSSTGNSANSGTVTTSGKMSAIYDTMKPAQIASIFAKLPDGQVCDALVKMDEQKAGKVLVEMPPDRAARLTMLVNQATASSPQTGQQAPSSPATSVP